MNVVSSYTWYAYCHVCFKNQLFKRNGYTTITSVFVIICAELCPLCEPDSYDCGFNHKHTYWIKFDSLNRYTMCNQYVAPTRLVDPHRGLMVTRVVKIYDLCVFPHSADHRKSDINIVESVIKARIANSLVLFHFISSVPCLPLTVYFAVRCL